ncbi:hypothetical protein SAMN04487906_1846 [Zhouia amylolytica]|uniref:Uncharacterized protein n=1 Tax=Zhouia amylolytica TaxID=376730 RepID=A0A1I6T4L6_9FLAO|nr:hypothetical protein [Zhouia amylolytica]SFS84050.1 hypothetical protein SAMN04487906_1846 [Zhouia amylolytica]
MSLKALEVIKNESKHDIVYSGVFIPDNFTINSVKGYANSKDIQLKLKDNGYFNMKNIPLGTFIFDEILVTKI